MTIFGNVKIDRFHFLKGEGERNILQIFTTQQTQIVGMPDCDM